MRRFIFIIGGARSGKSRYAVELAKRFKARVAFIATSTLSDEEMEERIKQHKSFGPRRWKVIEEAENVASILPQLKDRYRVILIDCLGMLISNLLVAGLKDKEIEKRIRILTRAILKLELITILVSNEVGAGIVPENPLARRFRDLIGFANQKMAEQADEVILMQSGLPLRIKGEPVNAKIK